MIAYRRFGDQLLGVSRAQLVYAARGISAPSPELRTKLSNFFGVAPGKLFSTAALAAKYYEYQIGDIVCWQHDSEGVATDTVVSQEVARSTTSRFTSTQVWGL